MFHLITSLPQLQIFKSPAYIELKTVCVYCMCVRESKKDKEIENEKGREWLLYVVKGVRGLDMEIKRAYCDIRTER